jgi:hypothetical protein
MHALGLPLSLVPLLGFLGALAFWFWLAPPARRRLQVAHLALWKTLAARPTTPRRTLRVRPAWRTWILHTLALSALLLAAADPRWGQGPARTVLFVIDVSPHMQAPGRDGVPLWRRAQDEARRLAHALLSGPWAHARVGVLAFSAWPTLVRSPTEDEASVDEALAKIQPGSSDETGVPERALALARALAKEQPPGPEAPEITVFSDFAGPRWQLVPREGFTAHVIGEAPPRPAVLTSLAYDGENETATVEVVVDPGRQSAGSPRQEALTVFIRGHGRAQSHDKDEDVLVHTLAPDIQEPSFVRLSARLPHAGLHHVEALLQEVRAPNARVDSLVLAVDAPPKWRVRRLGSSDSFLDAALASLDDVTIVREPPFDVAIMEGVRPDDDQGPALVFAPPRDGVVFAGAGERRMLLIDESLPRSSIMSGEERRLLGRPSGLSLADVNVGRLPRFALRPSDELVATAGGEPAVWVRARPEGPWIVVAFAPGQSDFPLRPSFPVFIRTAIRELAPRAGGVQITRTMPASEAASARLTGTSTAAPPRVSFFARPWAWLAAVAALAVLAARASRRRDEEGKA